MLKQIFKSLTPRLNHQFFVVGARCQSSQTDTDPEPRSYEKSINQVSLLGRVGSDPQKRGTEKHPVVLFSLATNSRYDTIDGEGNVKTDWHRISVFKPSLRDLVYTYLQKGQRVYVNGRISYGQIKDDMGNIRTTTSIIAEEVVFFQSSVE